MKKKSNPYKKNITLLLKKMLLILCALLLLLAAGALWWRRRRPASPAKPTEQPPPKQGAAPPVQDPEKAINAFALRRATTAHGPTLRKSRIELFRDAKRAGPETRDPYVRAVDGKTRKFQRTVG